MARKTNLRITNLIIIGILFIAAALRLVKLPSYPPSLYWEEVALGYDAYSILKTGHDYHGNKLPIVAFPSFGDYKPSVYFYATVPSLALFGLTDFAVRFPSALAGIGAVWLIFLIAKQLKFSNQIALLSAFILAIMPWHIQFSRAAFEVNLAVTLYLGAIYSFLKARQKPNWLFISTLLFAVTMYAYHGFRVLAPLTALATWLYEPKRYSPKHIVVSILCAFLLVSPILSNLRNPIVNQRFQETSFFPESQAVIRTNQLREQSGNTLISRIIYHRYWWWGKELLQNYLTNFHPSFLFLSGDDNPRHGIGETGPLYLWQAAAILGTMVIIINKKANALNLVFIWLLLAPLPVMLTKTNPHTLRMLPAAPFFALICAYCIAHIIQLKKYRQPLTLVVLATMTLEAIMFSHFYTRHYPVISAPSWQYGYKQAIEYVESIKEQYPAIYFTRDYGRPSIYALFYGKYDPSHIQAIDQASKKDQQELLAFDKYVFTDADAPVGSLVVTTPANFPTDQSPQKTIYFPDGTVAFQIYEKN